MTIKHHVSLPAIMTKIVLTGLMVAIAGVIRPAAPSVPSAQDVDLNELSPQLSPPPRMTEADFNSLPDDEQKRMLNELLELNGGKAHQAFLDAAKNGFLWAIAPLIKHGVLRASPEVGAALGIAAKNGDTEMVKLLLERGSKVIVRSTKALAGFAVAIDNGHFAIIQAFLAAGADPKTVGESGRTVLMAATRDDHIQMVQALLADRADSNAVDHAGRTALMYAALNGHLSTIEALLIAKADPSITAKNNDTTLMHAAYNHNPEIVKLLLAAGVNPDTINQEGKTALNVAVVCGSQQVVKELLTARANPNIGTPRNDRDCQTNLMCAIDCDRLDIAQELLAAKADSKIVNEYGTTALMVAADKGCIQMVQALLADGADCNITRLKGNAALIDAINSGHTPVVKLLLAAQADPNSIDQCGRTALMRAMIGRHCTDIVELLLAAQANVDSTDQNNASALIYAAGSGRIEAIQQLLAAQANLNIVNQDGGTALIFAFFHDKYFEMVPLLIDAYRRQSVNESCELIQHINDCQAHIELPALALNSDIKSAFEQLPLNCSHLIMQRLPISSLKCIRQVSKTCRVAAELPLLKALKEKIQREQKNKLLKIVDKQLQQAQGHYCDETQDEKDDGETDERISLLIKKLGEPYDFWQAALTEQLAMREAKQAQPLCGMFSKNIWKA